jgi:hypothetical protein
LRKENKEYIELDGYRPLTEEVKKRMEIPRKDIKQYGVSVIKKKKRLF